jgi:hypothetical protein
VIKLLVEKVNINRLIREGCPTRICLHQGLIQDFKLGGGALKKTAPNGGRCENFWGISCEKSRFYVKKSYFFQFFFGGGGACRMHPLPWIHPCTYALVIETPDNGIIRINTYIAGITISNCDLTCNLFQHVDNCLSE